MQIFRLQMYLDSLGLNCLTCTSHSSAVRAAKQNMNKLINTWEDQTRSEQASVRSDSGPTLLFNWMFQFITGAELEQSRGCSLMNPAGGKTDGLPWLRTYQFIVYSQGNTSISFDGSHLPTFPPHSAVFTPAGIFFTELKIAGCSEVGSSLGVIVLQGEIC